VAQETGARRETVGALMRREETFREEAVLRRAARRSLEAEAWGSPAAVAKEVCIRRLGSGKPCTEGLENRNWYHPGGNPGGGGPEIGGIIKPGGGGKGGALVPPNGIGAGGPPMPGRGGGGRPLASPSL
jgi:hypothetical protein